VPTNGQGLHVAGQVGGADELKKDVKGTMLDDVRGVKDHVGTERGDRFAGALSANGRRDVRAEQPAQLHRSSSDAARGAVDEQTHAHPEPTLGDGALFAVVNASENPPAWSSGRAAGTSMSWRS